MPKAAAKVDDPALEGVADRGAPRTIPAHADPPRSGPSARWPNRALRLALTGSLLALASAAPAAGFSLDDVAKRARLLAATPYREPATNQPSWLREISYDQWRDIRFRPDRALWLDRNLPFTVQFFHPGFFYNRSVRMNVVTSSGVAPVPFAPDQFDYGKNDSAAACRRISATRGCESTTRSRTRATGTR